MAGSYKHCVDSAGKLWDPRTLNRQLDNGGDVYEAVEEMYGMIWSLAATLEKDYGDISAREWVEQAEKDYKNGILESPGKN